MIPLPEEVTLSLLRGIGAFLRATPAPELPPEVRRFRGFRDAAMARHRDTILALLDDDAARRMMLEWLDEDKPSLRKRDAANLRIACERPEGWEKRLSVERRGTPGASAPAASAQHEAAERARLETALERQKEKSRRSRQELKREREQGAELLAAERARADAAAGELEALRASLADARRQVEAARVEAEAAERRADREVRRARRAAEEAASETARLRAELKARGRAERAELKARGRAERETAGDGAKRRPKPVRKPRIGPRESLKVPRGLLADAPATLGRWLDRDDVHLLVDGYNVTKAQTGYGDVELEAQRDRLIREVGNLAARRQIQATIVFDGSDVPVSGRPRRRGPVKVVFSKEGEIADDRIIGLLAELPPIPVVLATNDRELQERGRAEGATIATSDQLLALLR